MNQFRNDAEATSELASTLTGSEIEIETNLLSQTMATIANYAQATTQIIEHQTALTDRVASFADNFASAPMLETDIADIDGLIALGESLNIG